MTIISRTFDTAVRQVEAGLWQVTFNLPASTNCWLVEEQGGLTLIDTGHPWNAPTVLGAVKATGLPLKRIIITHAHPDHSGAAASVASISSSVVLAHDTEVPYLEGNCCLGDAPGSWLCRTVLRTGRRFNMLNPTPITKVESVGEGDMVGGLEIIHTPGHTPGSIALWSQKHSAIFTSDNICTSFNRLHIGLPWFTLEGRTQKQALKKLEKFPARLLLPGHGPVFRSDNATQDIMRLLDG